MLTNAATIQHHTTTTSVSSSSANHHCQPSYEVPLLSEPQPSINVHSATEKNWGVSAKKSLHQSSSKGLTNPYFSTASDCERVSGTMAAQFRSAEDTEERETRKHTPVTTIQVAPATYSETTTTTTAHTAAPVKTPAQLLDGRQLIIVIRHGERADEHTPTAMLNPPLTERGVGNVTSQLAPQLLTSLQQHYPFMDANYLKSEFVVVSSPFKRCVETASALLRGGVGTMNSLKDLPDSPMIDDRVCEVFGPIRIKANIAEEAYGGGEAGLAVVFEHEPDAYFDEWSRQKGSKYGNVSTSKSLPVWGETLEKSQWRYQNALCQLGLEIEHVPAVPKHLVIVTHGDMLNAVFGGLHPERMLYSVEYLGFAILERRLLVKKEQTREKGASGIGRKEIPRAPPEFSPRYFRMLDSNGLMWIDDEEGSGLKDSDAKFWDPAHTSEAELEEEENETIGSESHHSSLAGGNRNSENRRQKIAALAVSPSSPPPSALADRSGVGTVSSAGPPLREGQEIVRRKEASSQPPTATRSRTSSPAGLSSYGSCDDDVLLLSGSSKDSKGDESLNGGKRGLDDYLYKPPTPQCMALVGCGYAGVAGLHLAAFGVAAASSAGVEGKKTEAWATGVTGSVAILVLFGRHAFPKVRRVTDNVEVWLTRTMFCTDGLDSGQVSKSAPDCFPVSVPNSTNPTSDERSLRGEERSSPTCGKRKRPAALFAACALRITLRMVAFISLTVGLDVAAAYIASTQHSSTTASPLWSALTANAGPWVLLGCALVMWVAVEARLAPWVRSRRFRADSRRVESAEHQV